MARILKQPLEEQKEQQKKKDDEAKQLKLIKENYLGIYACLLLQLLACLCDEIMRCNDL